MKTDRGTGNSSRVAQSRHLAGRPVRRESRGAHGRPGPDVQGPSGGVSARSVLGVRPAGSGGWGAPRLHEGEGGGGERECYMFSLLERLNLQSIFVKSFAKSNAGQQLPIILVNGTVCVLQ